MNWRKRPVTFVDLLRAARQIGAGVLAEMPREEAAALVLATAMKVNDVDPEAPGIDWESLIAFVERLLPLILKIIDLFS